MFSITTAAVSTVFLSRKQSTPKPRSIYHRMLNNDESGGCNDEDLCTVIRGHVSTVGATLLPRGDWPDLGFDPAGSVASTN